MKYSDIVKKRKSIRTYEKTKVSKEQIKQIKENLKYVPIAKGRYDLFRIIFIKEEKTLSKLNGILNNDDVFKNAPHIFFIVYKIKYEHSLEQLNQNAGIISYNIALSATDNNLGSLICNYNLDFMNENLEFRKALKLYKDEKILSYILIGNAFEKQFVGSEHSIKIKDI